MQHAFQYAHPTTSIVCRAEKKIDKRADGGKYERTKKKKKESTRLAFGRRQDKQHNYGKRKLKLTDASLLPFDNVYLAFILSKVSFTAWIKSVVNT